MGAAQDQDAVLHTPNLSEEPSPEAYAVPGYQKQNESVVQDGNQLIVNAGRICCSASCENDAIVISNALAVEKDFVKYVPVGFDDSETLHFDNSFSAITRYRQLLLDKKWMVPNEDWSVGSTCGRPVTLLVPDFEWQCKCMKVRSKLSLDLLSMSLKINPTEGDEPCSITLPIDHIQAVCSATERVTTLQQVGISVSDVEMEQTVLLQYNSGCGDCQYVFFFEDSERSKDRLVQELRVVWLEKRTAQS